MKRHAPRLIDLIEEIDHAPLMRRVETIEEVASRYKGVRGMAYPTLRTKYYNWRKNGAQALVDGRKHPERACQKWARVLFDYVAKNKYIKTAWDEMMDDFRNGVKLGDDGPDWVSAWKAEHGNKSPPDACPLDWIPRGASYQNVAKAVRPMLRCGRKSGHGRVMPVKCKKCDELEEKLTQVFDELVALQTNCNPECLKQPKS